MRTELCNVHVLAAANVLLVRMEAVLCSHCMRISACSPDLQQLQDFEANVVILRGIQLSALLLSPPMRTLDARPISAWISLMANVMLLRAHV